MRHCRARRAIVNDLRSFTKKHVRARLLFSLIVARIPDGLKFVLVHVYMVVAVVALPDLLDEILSLSFVGHQVKCDFIYWPMRGPGSIVALVVVFILRPTRIRLPIALKPPLFQPCTAMLRGFNCLLMGDWSSPVHISSQDRNPYPRPPFSPHFQSTAAYMPSSKVYSCTRCLRRYSDRNELLRHKKEEHGKVTQGRAHYETIEDDICPYCHTRYAGSDGVAKHLRASRACAPIHAKWEQALSSAAPSTRASSSDSRSQDSDASDRSNALSH